MRIVIEVNVEQFAKSDLLEYAECMGCPQHKEIEKIRWLIGQYGRQLVNKMTDYIREREEEPSQRDEDEAVYNSMRSEEIRRMNALNRRD